MMLMWRLGNGFLAHLLWRAFDALDWRLTPVVCGPEPPTVADEMREADRERLRKAFPKIEMGMRR